MIPKLKVCLENGILVFGEKEQNYISSMPNGDYELTIKKPTSERTNQQNRYLWGCIYALLGDELGYSQEEIHELCKTMFLKDWIIIEKKDGGIKEFPTIKSTTSLTTKDMESYLRKIREWASIELGIFLPLPNEAEY